ncbi:tyrosine-type recombinase/integrase [Asticcacaulis excentricus]|uniref:tyrosine-type recombinase/integrase n=1 Tax=Asticcacaulis excentricus TaxID=78587 RepID=UPI0015626C8F|nr:tyrosine-type recombinase/integrase [Asticcacaulis excentricus]
MTDDFLRELAAKQYNRYIEEDRELMRKAKSDPLVAEQVERMATSLAPSVAFSAKGQPLPPRPNARSHSQIVRDYFEPDVMVDAAIIEQRLGLRGHPGARDLLSEALLDARIKAYWAQHTLPTGAVFPDDYKPTSGEDIPAHPSETWTIRTLAEEFISQCDPSSGWRHKIEVAADAFEQALGTAIPLSKITKRHVTAYVQLMLRVPSRYTHRFPGMSLHDAIAANGQLPAPYETLGPTTVKENYLSPIGRLFDFAENDLHARITSPARGIKVKGASKSIGRRTSFEIDELSRLFKQPLFSGCKSPDRTLTPGDFLVTDHQFWTPLLMLFTGARVSEIAQLSITDVKVEASTPHISILTEFDPDDPEEREYVKSFKTENSKRLIPLHPQLVELGLGEYVKHVAARGSKRLFPEWPLSTNERKLYSSATWVRRFNEKIIPEVTSRVPRPKIYNLRHTFKTRLAISEVPPQYQNKILGHAPIAMDKRYLDVIPIDVLYKSMLSLNYDGLDLSGIARYSRRTSTR